MSPELQQRAAGIRLLILDVDGVMTNGTVLTVPGPEWHIQETKGFHSHDGIALQWLVQHGIQTGLISGRTSKATEIRAHQLGMTYVYEGRAEKLPVLEEIILRSDLSASRIAYAGDDLVDIPIMRRVGLAFAPANARPEVKKAAHYVTTAAGGEGAVREMVEILLQAIGAWSVILKHYEVE